MSYFDIQVNGYGGVDFNQDNLSEADLERACRLLQEHGVGGILATIITEQADKMVARVARIVELRKQNPLIKAVVQGIHIEGPFLNEGKGFCGAHPIDAMSDTRQDLAERFLAVSEGLLRIFTLAPERDPGGRVTRLLSENGVVVSAGHTDASLDELKVGIDAGLSMFTHLGNGCPAQMPRHDNIVQRALALRKHLCLCFIADGVHVPFFALRNYMDLALDGKGCIVTSDAMTAAGLGPGTHTISRWTVTIGEDLAAWAPDRSHLLGSAISMQKAAQNLRDALGFDDKTVDYLTSSYPRELLGLS